MSKGIKMVKCKACGELVAKNTEICPHCGARLIKKKHPVLAVLCLILGFIIIGGVLNSQPEEAPENVEYIVADVHSMNKLLENNAMEAEDFTGQYIELTGYISVKDSDGAYISLGCKDDWCATCFWMGIKCYIKDDATLDVIKPLPEGSKITVHAKVIEVGEVLGYQCNIIEVVQ